MTQPGDRSLRLAPFRALRYVAHRVGDVSAVLCPPYDVIGEGGTERWEAAHPYNAVRLILPRAGPGENRYLQAAHELRTWLASGVLRRDDVAALYVYAQDADGLQARGLVGAVSLHAPAERVVLPHEEVFSVPVADRAALMAATGAQLEPILLSYDGGGPASDVVDEVRSMPPLAQATTADGTTHRLWQFSDPARVRQVQADLAGRQLLIADGHHRYAAYRVLQARGDDPLAAGASSGLAMLVDARRHPLQLGAIHRTVAEVPLPALVTALAAGFRRGMPLPASAALTDVLADAARSGPTFLLTDGVHGLLLQAPDRELIDRVMPAGRSATWRRLDASVACEFVLPRLLGARDTDPRVRYHHDAAEAIALARRHHGVALLLNPPRYADVLRIARSGERMPRKSTSFGPKPRTGVVMRLLNSARPAVPGRQAGGPG